MATNILGLMDYVQQQGDKGRQQGQQQSFNRLAGQAYTAPAAQQNALVGQMVGIDPTAGMAVDKQLQSNETDHMKKLGGAARYMASALQSKNPAQIEGAYQAVRPYLTQLSAASGKVPPPQWDPAMEPAVYQAIAQTSGDTQTGMPTGFREFEMTARAAGLQPGTPEYQQAARIALGSEGRASSAGIGFQKVTGADGRERIGRSNPRTGAFEVYNEQSGQFEPMGGPATGAAPPAMGQAITPQSPPMPDAAQRANAYLAQGMTPQQAAARVNADGGGMQRIQLAIDPSTGQFRDVSDGSAQVSRANPGLGVSRSPEETAAATEAAKQRVGLEYLPQTEAVKTAAAIDQARGTATVKNDAERQAAFPKNQAAVTAGNAELDRLAEAAQEVLNAPGLDRITGIPGALPNIPGSDAANAQAKLDALKSQVGFSVLQNMRNNSPTGGALGQVSDRENEMLQNNLAALSRTQSGPEYRKQLQKIIDYANGSKARRLEALQATYGGGAQQSAAAAGGWSIQRVQ